MASGIKQSGAFQRRFFLCALHSFRDGGPFTDKTTPSTALRPNTAD